MRTDMHNYKHKDTLIIKQRERGKNILIDDDVWIGYGVQIMPGVHIASGCVIGAGTIVTKDTEEYGECVAFPAKKLGARG